MRREWALRLGLGLEPVNRSGSRKNESSPGAPRATDYEMGTAMNAYIFYALVNAQSLM